MRPRRTTTQAPPHLVWAAWLLSRVTRTFENHLVLAFLGIRVVALVASPRVACFVLEFGFEPLHRGRFGHRSLQATLAWFSAAAPACPRVIVVALLDHLPTVKLVHDATADVRLDPKP